MIGVDGSPQMLAIAKAKMPGADFRLGDLRGTPMLIFWDFQLC